MQLNSSCRGPFTVLLCIDIGNTHITLGLFDGPRLRHHWRLATDLRRTRDDYGFVLRGMLQQIGCEPKAIAGSVLASVVPDLTATWRSIGEQTLGRPPHLFSAADCNDIPILYEPPYEVGADRLADVWAVREDYSLPACIVDFGTATTFDAVDREGRYLGGAIAPGLRIGADALFQKTSLLPKVDLAPAPQAIGRNTRHALQSGLFWGYVSMVEGMVLRFREELGVDMTVVGTGGLSRAFREHTRLFDHFAPWLTLQGLRYAFLARVEPSLAS